MRRALEIARAATREAGPRPGVGAVVLDSSGTAVGEGATRRTPGPHAEVVALAAAGGRARGGTVVVTLEPCSHTGATGPCTDALVAAGVVRVVYAVADPNPVAAGGGAVLQAAGVSVEAGLLGPEAERVHEAWLLGVRRERPFVTWKYAASLDGQVAAADGSSRWVTSEQSRADVHQLRSQVDAVVVGRGTVLADDPHLTARPGGVAVGPADQPLRVVLDSLARTHPASRVLDDAAATLVVVSEEAPPDRVAALRERAEVLVTKHTERGVHLPDLLGELHARGVVHLLLEGGPTLAGSFAAAGLVDRVVGYLAPVLLGSGRFPALTGAGLAVIGDAVRLRLDEVVRIGPDLRLTARPEEG
ncbi:MAG: bifunctional diaminohydroxyphosphoribosylaminopyrimidine deaminase/5-amino-6-(5-phosphoribosylamino)uracil reductase RibD [Actinomycetota bacterium]|nr:bifunctional diaminohydroxyphosphoribosylaminopyrimidine deaminase/5-amino-6-(5-phosphoribosylamino)uracil reductase RibD [Actinomycetota bacterium]